MSEQQKNKSLKSAKTNKNTFVKTKEKKIEEIGGPKGPEPTRYGDWNIKGRVSDF